MSFRRKLIDFVFIGIFINFLPSSHILYVESVKTKTYFYIYKTNITHESQKPTILRSIHGQVYLTEFQHEGQADTDIRLWQVSLAHKLPKNSGTLVLEAVTIHKSGLIDRILIPDSQSLNRISELNLLKGLLSLFNIQKTFEPGYEIDSSGECQVSYALVDSKDKLVSSDFILVDKLKQNCRRLNKPLDQWYESSLPIGKIHNQQQMITRYKVSSVDARLLKISGFEEHIYSPMKNSEVMNLNSTRLVSWQEVEFKGLMAGQTDSLRQKLSHLDDVKEDQIGNDLFGSQHQTIHLTLAHSIIPTSCGLNTNLYPKDSSQRYSTDYLIKTTLRRQLESTQNMLKSNYLGHIQHTHPIIQLVQSLRCLPNTLQAVELLIDVTLLASPAIDSELLMKQANTWRNQLVDVLIGCGTETCTNVLLKRLEDLTNLITEKQSETKLPVSNLKIYEKMLFDKLWPSLSQLKRLRSNQMKQLIGYCQLYQSDIHNQICLVTLANLYEKVIDKNEKDLQIIVQMTFKLINVYKVNGSDQAESVLKGLDRKNLMVGIIITSILKDPLFIPTLFDIALKSGNVPMVIRTLALRSAVSIHFSDHVLLSGQNNYDWSRVVGLMKQALLEPPTHLQDDLLLGQEIFRGLLQGEIPIHEVADLLRELSVQKRWGLVQVGRIIINQWCENEMLSFDDCICFRTGFKSTTEVRCRLGLAADWWGLAGDNQTRSGRATLLNGDLANLEDSLIVYFNSLQILGSGGDLRMNDLVVNLLSMDSDLSLFEFGIYADGLDATSIGFGSVGKSNEPDETWFTLNLRILGTNLVPWEVFSGGLSQIIKLVWSAPNKPTSILQSIRIVADERSQTSFSSGWTIVLDSLGIMSLDLSGALETSLWSQSSRSLVRTKVGAVVELQIYVQDLFPEFSVYLLNQGLGFEGQMDFVTQIQLKNLPDSVCMGMNRGVGTQFITFERQRMLEDMVNRRKRFVFQDLTNPLDYVITRNISFPPVSYNLGFENSIKCKHMDANVIW